MEIWRNVSNSLPICLYVNVWCFRLSSECTWPNSVSRSWSDNCGRLWRFSVSCEAGKPDGNTSLPSTRWYLYRAGTRELEYADSKAVFIVTKHEVGKNSPFLFLNVFIVLLFIKGVILIWRVLMMREKIMISCLALDFDIHNWIMVEISNFDHEV